MKLLTLNTHSWINDADPATYAALIQDILENEYDAIALQEVNQLSSGPAISNPEGYLATQTEFPIKEDNFAYFLIKALAKKELFYHWSWVPCHVGYVRFDEGVAILSKEPIQSVEQVQLSTKNDFRSYHTRRALVVQTASASFISVHMSWWKKLWRKPFLTEWRSLETAVKKIQDKPVYIMGDFNNPADIRKEGYDLITLSGWYDAYAYAAVREGSATVPPAIDGWQQSKLPLRIDYIFSNRPQAAARYEIKFDGNKQPCVSDHYGVAVTYS
ncbi:endonuclease/exonuclease/phosphatase [Trichococcus palustris]|uniref:Endonuclease/exonuclease/phosphatase n=1 Tax=Trichococcus palustris TaxID=140314 RepID=A0A143YTX3_9LACT|nr:endonuclease/exonuclease/phosphatase family protein [Trichococcus palustris]CZQ98594.1 endonuclease/exonuclease/phosphatase [Trichococcus palustris]SFK94386.1 maltose 6'-phosphate phosphatase [Trichococcus palustris]